MDTAIKLVKVFSVTKATQREALGDRVTDWIRSNPDVRVLRTVVAQSSDKSFHCLSIVLLCDTGSSPPVACPAQV